MTRHVFFIAVLLGACHTTTNGTTTTKPPSATAAASGAATAESSTPFPVKPTPSHFLVVNMDDATARSSLGHGLKNERPVYDKPCMYAKRDNVERPQAWYSISRDALEKNPWMTQISRSNTRYYNIERYQNGGGMFVNVASGLVAGSLGFDLEFGGAYFYDMNITHSFILRTELKEAAKYDREKEGAADYCGKASDVCGDQYIRAIHCGTLTVSRVREEAFSANGEVKVNVLVVSGSAGASLNSAYSQQTGQILEGCFLLEPEDFNQLIDPCPQRLAG